VARYNTDGSLDTSFGAACALALCVPIMDKNDQLEAGKRQAAAKFYGDEAMKMLKDAVAKGCKNAAHIKKDGDLDALRKRADFEKLLGDLEAKKK
jgi:hypothetical protein